MTWEQLQQILAEPPWSPAPPVACPLCGQPLEGGHCTFDGWKVN